MSKKDIISIVVAMLLSSVVFFTTSSNSFASPREVYRVYLDGKSLGLIESKSELEEYIDKKEEELKAKYNVDKVFIPNNLDIVKEITYNSSLSSVTDIYNQIKAISPFTITGYKITIKGTEEQLEEDEEPYITDDSIIYVLDQEVFVDAVRGVINAFVKDNGYDKFLNNKQEEIVDTGTIIEDVYVKNEIIIKEANISVEEDIFTNIDDLKKYLLFGTVEDQDTYRIKEGDTIADVAYNNKLSTGEFLIANPQFTNENNLLYVNQVVNVGLINPLIRVVEENHTVSLETHAYEIIYEDDPDLIIGYDYVKQEGVDGIDRVTRKIQQINGEISSAIPISTEEVKPSISKVIVRGQKYVASVGNPKIWAWPTNKPYMLSTRYEWRWGKLHEGIDIYSTGYGSPIYAANNGVVVQAEYHKTSGYYITINHNNGYYTLYAHLAKILVKTGQVVEMGQKIATMGNSGSVYPVPSTSCPTCGTHLHFAVWKGNIPFYSGSYSIDPLGLYR